MEKHSDLFWQLLKQEHNRARAFCFRLSGSLDDGDDLYQDSVIDAYHGFEQLKKLDSFRAWLYRIISNRYRAKFRSPWWKKIVGQSSKDENSDHAMNPVDVYDAKRKLEYAFKALSAEERIVVTLSDLEGWKNYEVAKIIGKSEGAVKMKLKRARDKMRTRLAGIYRKESKANQKEESINYAMSPGSKDSE